jgi:hypothetical protein
MGTACSTNGGEEECIRYWWESQRERNHWEEQDIGRWTILKMDLREIEWDGMDWIDLAQDGDQWRALVNTVMHLRVPENAERFLSVCTISGFSRMAQLRE